MTTKELEKRVRVLYSSGYGHKVIRITYRGIDYEFVTSNTLATDRLLDHGYDSDRKESGFYTYKQALQTLWNEFYRHNRHKK